MRWRAGRLSWDRCCGPPGMTSRISSGLSSGVSCALAEPGFSAVIMYLFPPLKGATTCARWTRTCWPGRRRSRSTDAQHPASNARFYQKAGCKPFRNIRKIPDRTRIWIGRWSMSSLGVYGTDVAIVSPDLSKIGMGAATTLVLGHLRSKL